MNKASCFSNMLVVLIFHHKPVDNPDINDPGSLFTKKTPSMFFLVNRGPGEHGEIS